MEPQLSPTLPKDAGPVAVGWSADWVHALRGKPIRTHIVGQNELGYIVDWYYDDVVYTMARGEAQDLGFGLLSWYCVQAIRPNDSKTEKVE